MKKKEIKMKNPALAPKDDLKKATDSLSGSKSPEEKKEFLSKAFELFSQETARLESAYHSLQSKFSSLTKELEIANMKLHQKVIELDVTAHYLESILTNMTQGLVFIDLNGMITTYNKAAEQLLGKTREEVLYRHFNEVFPDDLFHFSMKKALEEAESPHLSYATFIPPNNPTEPIELMVETTFVLSGEKKLDVEKRKDEVEEFDYTMGMIVLFRDITEIRYLQTIATRNDRMKDLGEMAAMVAHEIRNPLGGIKGFASLLVRDLESDPKLQEMAQYIIEGTDNLNRLVTNVLNYSRPLRLDCNATNAVHLIEEIAQHSRMDKSLSPNITIETEAPKHPINLLLDTQLFKSALLNLILNAVQAMPSGGKIQITLKQEKNYGIIKVIDTGVGIIPEHMEKIFRPFFTTKPQGHGFGLAEVFKVIQAHNGTIDVSSNVNEGTTFTIRIPCS